MLQMAMTLSIIAKKLQLPFFSHFFLSRKAKAHYNN